MKYYAVYLPKNKELANKEFYLDKEEAFAVLRLCKEARLKEFSTAQEAREFHLNGDATRNEPVAKTKEPSAIQRVTKSAFPGPTSQQLVEFRKLIEANNLAMVKTLIDQNPRFLISSADYPTILKEGTRYNALHVVAMHDHGEMCRMILQTIEQSEYIVLLHGRTLADDSTTEIAQILLDMYLNTPDKSRGETPLHFAAKYGSVSVVKELIAYPQCKPRRNKDGLLPRDIICSRANSLKNTAEIAQSIRRLLDEQYIVPVWRSDDPCLQPIVGSPLDSPTKLPLTTTDQSEKVYNMKAYAGPMDRDQANSFYMRWRTPPRLIPSPRLNPSPRLITSPCEENVDSPRHLDRFRTTSTPQRKARRLHFSLPHDRSRSLNGELELSDSNGNRVKDKGTGDAGPSGIEEIIHDFSSILNINDSVDCSPLPDWPDSFYSGSLDRSSLSDWPEGVNKGATIVSSSLQEEGSEMFDYVCNETQQQYNRSNLTDTPSYRERQIRIRDQRKGLETIGRQLASQYQVEWHEYWEFLGEFADLASADGLQKFENKLEARSKVSSVDDAKEQKTIPNIHLEEVKHSASGKLSNPYACLVKSLNVFVNRFINSFTSECSSASTTATPFSAVTKLINSLDSTIASYRKDNKFTGINFDKAHSVFAYLVLSQILRSETLSDGALAKVKQVLHDTAAFEMSRNVNCVERFFMIYVSDLTLLKGHIDGSERDLWENDEFIAECVCHQSSESSAVTGNRTLERMNRRREKRSSMDPGYLFNVTAYRDQSNSDEEYYSCSDGESHDNVSDYGTPPTSPPTRELDALAEREKPGPFSETDDQVFIGGSKPDKNDADAWVVLATTNIDKVRYPHVYKWHQAMKYASENTSS